MHIWFLECRAFNLEMHSTSLWHPISLHELDWRLKIAKHEITMISPEQNQTSGKKPFFVVPHFLAICHSIDSCHLSQVVRNFLSVYARRVSRKCRMRSTMWLGARFEVPIKKWPEIPWWPMLQKLGEVELFWGSLGVSPWWQWNVFMQFRA